MHGSHAAIIAAEQQRKKREQEQREEEDLLALLQCFAVEEKHMKTNVAEIVDQYEFKIVRSASRVFHRPAAFQQLLEDEAQAGWELMEKMDDSRVRFKRHKDLRRKDSLLSPDIDPYRSQIGRTEQTQQVMILLGVFIAIGLVVFSITMLSQF